MYKKAGLNLLCGCIDPTKPKIWFTLAKKSSARSKLVAEGTHFWHENRSSYASAYSIFLNGSSEKWLKIIKTNKQPVIIFIFSFNVTKDDEICENLEKRVAEGTKLSTKCISLVIDQQNFQNTITKLKLIFFSNFEL